MALLLLGPTAASGEELPDPMTSAELWRRIEAGEAPTVIDVRTEKEFEAGHVPGAIHIPFWSIWGRLSEIPTPSEEPVVVTCEHGPRAGLAWAALRMAGFDRVILLEGHMSGWKRVGLPMETP